MKNQLIIIKRLKTKFQDPDFVTADNKNAIETPFFAISEPQKGIGGTPIGFWEESN